jgi:hypothetical protein
VITLVHLASAASLWAAFQGTVAGGATTRGGARQGNTQFNADYDVDVIPGAGVSANEGRLNVSLGYAPMFNFRNVGSGNEDTIVLHNGYFRLGYDERGFNVALTQSASLGTMAFRGLRVAPIDPKAPPDPTVSRVDPVPVNQVQRVMNLSTGLSAGYRWDARLNSGASGYYSVGGGWGAEARKTLAQIRTIGGGISTSYQLTGTDSTGADLNASDIRTHGGLLQVDATGQPVPSPDFEYMTLNLNLNWRHRFSALSTGSLSGGAYGYSSTPPGRTRLYTVAIAASGSYDTQLAREGRWVFSGGAGAGVGPTVNSLSGQIQQRVQGSGRLTASLMELSITAIADGTQSFPVDDPQAIRVVGVGVGAGYAVTKFMDLGLDYRNAWQSTPVSPVTHMWTAFLTMSLRAPPVRF